MVTLASGPEPAKTGIRVVTPSNTARSVTSPDTKFEELVIGLFSSSVNAEKSPVEIRRKFT